MVNGWSAPSEEELAATMQSDFDVLPEDEYIAVVKGVEVKKDVVNKFPSKSDPGITHDMLIIKCEALTFANGEDLVDENDQPLDGPVPFQAMLNPKKIGMIPMPSNTRKFFAAVLGQPVGDPIQIGDWAEIIGKQFIVTLKPNGGYNNPKDYRSIRRSRSRGTTAKGPVDGGELMKRAEGIFNEDAPTNIDPNPLKANPDDLDF